jgi:hypothetical protein
VDELLLRVEPANHRYFGDRPIPSSSKSIDHMWVKFYYLYFAIWAPLMEDSVDSFVRGGSATDHIRIACALERFRMEKGVYPAALAELAPEFLVEIPSEIVNGEPYRYRRTNYGGFVLYSVGMDLHDDGGVVDPALKPRKQKDWVFTYPPSNP